MNITNLVAVLSLISTFKVMHDFIKIPKGPLPGPVLEASPG